jgi:hypothetical protein
MSTDVRWVGFHPLLSKSKTFGFGSSTVVGYCLSQKEKVRFSVTNTLAYFAENKFVDTVLVKV